MCGLLAYLSIDADPGIGPDGGVVGTAVVQAVQRGLHPGHGLVVDPAFDAIETVYGLGYRFVERG